MQRQISILILVAIFITCSGCVTYFGKDGPYYGRIVESETKQPLEGVVVVGDWGIVHWSPGGANTTYYDTYETITDNNGDFTIPGQGIQVFSDLSELQLFALKAGYKNVSGYMWNEVVRLSLAKEKDRVVIGLKKLTMEERIKSSIITPSGPKIKYKHYIRERNKEMIELRMPPNTILPEE